MHRWSSRGGRSIKVRFLSTALAAMSALTMVMLTATAPGASASTATTVDYTCHKQNYGIYTCQWLRQSLVYDKLLGRNQYQFVTWASMKDGTVNREIIQIKLQYQVILGSTTQWYETSLDVKGGTGTISASLGPDLCFAAQYRPIFQFKYFEPKPNNKWVSGWSYGLWYNAAHLGSLCDANPGPGR